MYVRRADLAPVTTREVSVDHVDGTGFTLSAGVIAEPGESGDRVSVDGNHLSLALPEDAVGLSYAEPTRRLRDADAEEVSSMPGGELWIGGAEVDLSLHDATVEYAAAPLDPERQLVTFTYACSAYRAVFVGYGGGTGIGTIGCGEYGTIGSSIPRPRVRAGAPLTWLDGSPAGETLEEVVVVRAVESADQRLCFQEPLRQRNHWPDRDHALDEYFVTVCADASDVSD
jgi:hypothetical protein